jgi:hypothetical protein
MAIPVAKIEVKLAANQEARRTPERAGRELGKM